MRTRTLVGAIAATTLLLLPLVSLSNFPKGSCKPVSSDQGMCAQGSEVTTGGCENQLGPECGTALACEISSNSINSGGVCQSTGGSGCLSSDFHCGDQYTITCQFVEGHCQTDTDIKPVEVKDPNNNTVACHVMTCTP